MASSGVDAVCPYCQVVLRPGLNHVCNPQDQDTWRTHPSSEANQSVQSHPYSTHPTRSIQTEPGATVERKSDIHHSPAVLLKPSDYDPLQHEIKKDSSQQLNPLLVYSASIGFTTMDSIYIEFHCLLSAQQWGFDDSSHVYMRFAALQNYDCCYGPMKIIRSSGDYLELSFVMQMPMYIVKSEDAALRRYKYHVESPATKGGVFRSMEFIAGPSTKTAGVIDRSLILTTSLNKLHCNATYQHYDGIVWPELVDKATSDTSIKAKFFGLFRSKATGSDVNFTDVKSLSQSKHRHYRVLALEFYLDALNDILSGQCRSNPCQFLKTIFAIYASVYNCALFYDHKDHLWTIEEVKQEIYQQIKEVTKSLVEKIRKYPNTNHSNEVLVLLVTYYKCKCFSKFCSDSSNRLLLTVLLRSMILDQQSYKVHKILFSEYGSSIIEMFKMLLDTPLPLEWIYAVPLMHLATKQCNPFDTLRSISWNFDEAVKGFHWGDAGILKDVPVLKHCLSDTYLKDLQLQFHIDPLLSRLIVKKTSINNLSSLFGHVPLSVLMMKLAQECFHNIKPEIKDLFSVLLGKVFSVDALPSFQCEEDTATIKNCLYFFEISLRNFNKHDEEFIDLIIQLVLFILSKQSFSQDTINEVGSKLVALLKIIIHKLLYTATFGENNQFQAEIQFWSKMAQVTCAENIIPFWHSIVKTAFISRLPDVSKPKETAFIFCMLDSQPTPVIFSESVFDHLLRSVERTLKIDSELAKSFETMAKNPKFSRKIFILFNTVLLKKYPEFNNTKQVSVMDVLSWELWPIALKVFVTGCSIEDCSSDIVLSALFVIKQLCNKIITGNITMDELSLYHHNHMMQLKAMCVAANSGVKPLCPDYADVSAGVTTCDKMFNYVTDCCQKLETVVKYCAPISSELTKTVSDQLKCNMKSKQISSICKITKNNQFTCTLISFAELPPCEMLEGLRVLAKEYHNSIFDYFWKKNSESFCMAMQNMSSTISFNDVHEKVWKPTIANCQTLLCKFHNKTVTLVEVNVYGQSGNIGNQLQTLCTGMSKYFPKSDSFPAPGDWIKQVANHIMTFQKFSNDIIKKNGITYCLKLKEYLELKGNFSILEDFNKQVATSFSHTVLTDISMQRLELLAQVNKLYNNQSLQRFFDEMLKNIELMNWLKEITSDSNQLKCFTDVCKGLTEDQFDQYDERRLTQLYNVGEHFACIIYDLPESIGFNEFFEKCQIIANTLIKRFHLVGDMGECSKHLEWFKSLKLSLGVFRSTNNEPLHYSRPETKTKSCITIQFFCLLSAEQWRFDDKTSKVYLRFAANELGTYSTCHGPMIPTNGGNNKRGKGEYLEYHFSVKIPQKVFTNQDATVRRYKYHVESPATEEGVLKSWELIPIPKQSSGVIDRSLKLYNDETTCGLTYQRFDGIILPEHTKPPTKPSSGFIGTVASGISYLYSGSKQNAETCDDEKLSSFKYDTKKLSDANHQQLRKNALLMHLEHYYCVLSGEEELNNPIENVETVCAVFASLNSCHLSYKTFYHGNHMDHSWTFNETKTEMIIWLSNVIKKLVENIEKSPEKSNLCNILSMLIIYSKMQMLVGFCYSTNNLNCLQHLLHNMAIDFSSNYHTTVQVLWKQYKDRLLKTVTTLANGAASLHSFNWIFAIPILHLLGGHCKPSQHLSTVDWDQYTKCKKYQWGDNWQVSDRTQNRVTQYLVDKRDMKDLQPLFEIDPLLLRLFVKQVSISDLEFLCGKVPTSILIMRLAQEAQQKVETSLYKPVEVLLEALSAEQWIPLESEEDMTTVKAALYFLEVIVKHAANNQDFFKFATKIFLVSASRVQSCFKEVKDNATKKLTDIVKKASQKICHIGIFNVQVVSQRKHEIQYWNEMLKFDSDSCVKEFWHDICNEVIDSRLLDMKPNQTISILMEIDASETHKVVSYAILNHLIKGVQHVEQKDLDQTELLTELQRLIQDPSLSDKVLSLLNKLLNNKYPNFATTKTLQIQEILAWKLWPNFIKILVAGCDEKEDLQTTCEIAFAVVKELKQLLENLTKGSVTVKDFVCYKAHDRELKALCESASLDFCPPFAKISSALKTCSDKVKCAKICRLQLSIVVEYCKPISEELTQTLGKEISDHSDNMLQPKRICDLCNDDDDDGNYKCVCFSTNGLPIEMIKYCIVIGKNENIRNQLFDHIWKQQANDFKKTDAAKSNNISYSIVFDQVWVPTISCCKSLLSKLHNKSVTLTTIEDLIQIENFADNLMTLCTAMLQCYPDDVNVPPPQQWVPQLLVHVSKFQEISNNPKCIEATNIILKVKNSLSLIGDFKIIECLADNMKPKFKEQKLENVDEKLIDTWIHVRDMYSNPEFRNCLEVFSANTSLVRWLRETTTGVGQLASFIEVCRSTAEEEFNMERLAFLHSVGTEFASLIYDFSDKAGFETFDEKCSTVWSFLKKNPKLAGSLVECNNHLEWFKELKATQGSIEVAAITRVKDVNEWGEYIICSTDEKPLMTIGDAIKLKIHRSNAVKTEYTLDDLRDLESKLVLITGKHSAGKQETDRFLNYLHLVCRITDALLTLRSAGHEKYIVWSYSFFCDYDVYNTLDNQARAMESELKEWTGEIAALRSHFHALNYFTTQQLCIIRQKLGQLNCETIKSLPADVLSMLMSISFKICEQEIKDALQATKVEDTVVDRTSSSTDKIKPPAPSDYDVKVSQIIEGEDVNIEVTIEKKLSQLIEQLTELDRKAFEEIKDSNFSDAVAYLSIKHCTNESSQNMTKKFIRQACKWCMKEGDTYENMDKHALVKVLDSFGSQNNQNLQENSQGACGSDTMPTSQNTGEEIDGDNTDNQFSGYQEKENTVAQTNSSINIDFIEQELIENDIPSGLAREAAKLFPTNLKKALRYCLEEQNLSTTDELVQSVITCSSNMRGDGKRKNPYVEQYDRVKVNEYLELERLAKVLEQLVDKFSEKLSNARCFHNFQPGEPNLVLVPSGTMLKTALSVYCDIQHPFPSMEEIVICTAQTTTEEIVLLWRRALKDPGHKQIFCLIHGEKLSYKVCDESIAELDKLSQGNDKYRLMVMCSSESQETSHVVSKLLRYKRDYTVRRNDADLSEYLKHHLMVRPGSTVDPDNLSVKVVTSAKPGMGKSLHIKKLAENLKMNEPYCVVPVHGPKVDVDTVVELLKPHAPSYQSPVFQIIHIDIDSEVLSLIDTVLFSLLILKSLKHKNGIVWRVTTSQLYMLEVTFNQGNQTKAFVDQHESISSLLRLLPQLVCSSPIDSMKKENKDDAHVNTIFNTDEFKTPAFQCVYEYLRRYDSHIDLSDFMYDPKKLKCVQENYALCISAITKHCSVVNPSWATLAQFVRFLYVQLSDCQKSIFCNKEFFAEDAGFKKFVVRFMIRMSKDFSMPSLIKSVAENSATSADEVVQREITEERKWDKSKHPYIFFNQDQTTLTFIGFNVNENLQCTDPKNPADIIEGYEIPKSVYECLLTQGLNLKEEDCNSWDKTEMIERLCRVTGVNYADDPDESYVLTTDNLLKMMAIHMRFRCNIPVVIMGETGCGKTRLIRYMCELQKRESGGKNLVMLKVHGGTSEQDIINAVNETVKLAKENFKVNKKLYTMLFFDEANTTENIGLIKEIMCDRRLKGKPISDNVKFIAACNPYRKHTEEMIEKLETAGLGYYVKAESTQHKFGSIPLRHLVYRVLDLPPSMDPLLYDFGQVTGKPEKDYITQIVTNHVCESKQLSSHSNKDKLIKAIAKILKASQSFMRSKKDECSFVSLRDVERAMIVFQWFYDKDITFQNLLNKEDREIMNRETRSMVMTLAVCYHARIQQREEFEMTICAKFHKFAPLMDLIDKGKFQRQISSFQGMILSQMKPVIPKNIAHNAALKENVFMMLVCIELKIPLFVIGKPGSSKSLAKSIIENSMQGASSTVSLCRQLKQVKLFSYQCSQHSTPESILEVFSSAKKFQESKDVKQFVSVVVLDEVGLAEDSPSLPLKALHPLLEDGTSGADANVQHIEREQRVSFIGISNWALDPAKMNRGVMITRGIPDENELEQSARGICSTEDKDPVRDKLEPFFVPLAQAYMEISEKQPREFFGLRDFYSLIKMLYWMVEKTKEIEETEVVKGGVVVKETESTYSSLTQEQLLYAVKRNFDGLDEFLDENSLKRIFIDKCKKVGITSSTDKQNKVLHPDCDPLALITASLSTRDTTWHGESRYLLFMTENFAALRVLQQHLLQDKGQPPYVLFGSSFPKDMEYTQVCRNINQIKICMETGRTAILLNLENLYESLYDVLNQYYTKLRENRYVDLGLQSHRIKCRVDDKFKMILIAEKETVYRDFPTPLINRLEKHYVVTSTILTDAQKRIMEKLIKWTEDFATLTEIKESQLPLGDAFVGYQEDTTAAVVFQAYHNVEQVVFEEKMQEKLAIDETMQEEKLASDETQQEEKLASDETLQEGKLASDETPQEEKLASDETSQEEKLASDETPQEGKLASDETPQEEEPATNETLQEELETLQEEKLASDETPQEKLASSEGLQEEKLTSDETLLEEKLANDKKKEWLEKKVLEEGKRLLLNIASPDAIMRLKYSKLKGEFMDIFKEYFINQSHASLSELLKSQLSSLSMQNTFAQYKGLLLQVTTHSHLLSEPDVAQLCIALNLNRENVTWYLLQEFDTEMDFCNKLKQLMQQEDVKGDDILIIQCDSGHLHSNLIACARHKVIDEIVIPWTQDNSIAKTTNDVPTQEQGQQDVEPKLENEDKRSNNVKYSHVVHIVFVVQLPRKSGGTNFVGFQGGNWISVHLDDLRSQKENEISFQNAIELSISEIFSNTYQQAPSEPLEQNLELSQVTEQSQQSLFSELQPFKFNANRRLRDLIQMACSFLYDKEQNRLRTTERINILTDLIPSEPTKESFNFDHKLVQFVTAVLREMDDNLPETKEWAFKEALMHSQISGTFRNALSRRLDKILLPILAKIIGLIDKNYNLTIIHNNRDNERIALPIAKIWLEIFSDRKLCRITYEEVFTNSNVRKPKKWVPGIGTNLSDHFYTCQFPFSWICREVINLQKQDATVLAGKSKVSMQKKMTELVQTALGSIFESRIVPDDEKLHDDLCCLYLNDYIAAVYKPTNDPTKDDEHKLVYKTVYVRFKTLVDNTKHTILEKLVLLHLAYGEAEPQLQQFKQLVSLSPKIVQSLKDTVEEKSDFRNEISDIALCAVKLLLIELQHNKDWNVAQTKEWIGKVAYYQNSIVSILNLNTQCDSTEAKNKWICILVLKSFAVTVGLHYKSNSILTAIKRLKTCVEGDTPSFKDAEALEDIALVLQTLQKEMKSSVEQKELHEYLKFIHCCEKFFIEIISTLCFEKTYDSKEPTPELIDYLMDCIYTSKGSTQLTPFLDKETDAVPIVRSYLLRLLIGIKANTKESLEKHFERSRQLAEKADKGLYVLYSQCFEDELHKHAASETETTEKCLKENFEEYIHSYGLFSINNLMAIAKLRYHLSQLAIALCKLPQNGAVETSPKDWKDTLEYVQAIFHEPKGKYPAEYVVKFIIRQYGIERFNELKTSYPWIVPEHLKSKEENSGDQIINPVQVYHTVEGFDKLLEALTVLVTSSDSTELDKVVKELINPGHSVMITMAIYANVTLKIPSMKVLPKNLDELKKYVAGLKNVNDDLKKVTSHIVNGDCNNTITTKTQTKLTSHSTKMIGVVVHCVCVILQQKDVPFLKPCVELLKNPGSLKVAYLPTMPILSHDLVFTDHLMGSYYICKNDHVFLVITEDCKKVEEMKCHCNAYVKVDANTKKPVKFEKAGVIDTGHILGKADTRSKESFSCSVIRVILHSILIWYSCFSEADNTNLSALVNPHVPEKLLPLFFWKHLEKDLVLLSIALDCSIDDAVMRVHLLFKQLSEKLATNYPNCSNGNDWSTAENRQEWEDHFSVHFIAPCIQNSALKLKDVYCSVVKDTDTFYSRIYESAVDSNDQSVIHSALWRYRTRVSLEHIMSFSQNREHKILSNFLQKESILRAMQYLPGILKLQKYLFDHFHHQVGQETQLHDTIGKYKKSRKQDQEMFDGMVKMFSAAWELVKRHLINHGRLRVPLEYVDSTPEITDDTKLVYLLPTTTGEGICSTSLVDFLVAQHNEFIKYCYNNLPSKYYDEQVCKKLMEHAIPLSQLQLFHVVCYEHKLIPVILTHCQYSLQYGKGTEVTYDLQAIERDLCDKFIFGKPLIMYDEVPRVVLRKDAHDIAFYESIAAKVPQEDLPFEKKEQLIIEVKKLKNQQKLGEILDVIEIVLGFLDSAGGECKETFHSYVTKTLTMQKNLPKLIKECVLANAISLWGVVSVVQCCQMTTLDKEPFDRLDKVYCVCLNDKTTLQQVFTKYIDSPIDFLTALHNFIVVHVSHALMDECNPEWSLTEVWVEVMEEPYIQNKDKVKSITFPEEVKMCHVADVWKQAVELLWQKQY